MAKITRLKAFLLAVIGGIGLIAAGFLYAFGADIYEALKQGLPSHWVDPRFLVFTILVISGIAAIACAIAYGIWIFRKERSEGIQLYPFDRLPQLLSKAKEEVAFLGVSLEKISGSMHKIEQLLAKGIRVRFLILDILEPDNVKLAMNVEDVGSSTNLKGDLLGVLCKTRSRLPEETKKRFEIKKYGILPLYSMILIDPDADDGLILHEPHLYDTEPALRDHFLIPRKKNEATFQKYLKSYRFVLDKSVTYRCQTPVSSLVKVTRAKPEEEVKELHVRFRKFPSSPDKVYEARFCFITIENVEGRTIKVIEPLYKFEGTMRKIWMLSPYGKPSITVDYEESPRQFSRAVKEKGVEAVYLALGWDMNKMKRRIDFLRGKGEHATFALFYTIKGFNNLCIPSYTRVIHDLPFKGSIGLFIGTKNNLPCHVATYDVNIQKWDWEPSDVKEVVIDGEV